MYEVDCVQQIGVSRSATALIIVVDARTSFPAGSCVLFAVVRSVPRGESTASRAPLTTPVSHLRLLDNNWRPLLGATCDIFLRSKTLMQMQQKNKKENFSRSIP